LHHAASSATCTNTKTRTDTSGTVFDRRAFVLFGGEDGWLGSANYADQVALWRHGRSIALPLTPATVVGEFPTQMILKP
jgi:Penicillin amidase